MSNRSTIIRTSNPVANEAVYHKAAYDYTSTEAMTVQGAINKSIILLAILMVTAAVSWLNPSNLYFYGGMIVGLIAVVVSGFKKDWSPILAPIYAAAEGFCLGSLSAMVHMMFAGAKGAFFGGLVFQAITLTFSVLFVMLMIYRAGWIKVTDKFRAGIVMATGAIFIVYLLNWVLSLFGINIPYIHEGGTIGIIFSLVVIVIASLNLLLDFDTFEKGAEYGAPKFMEWFAAMGLLVTLVWLYIEILRLLMILSSNRN